MNPLEETTHIVSRRSVAQPVTLLNPIPTVLFLLAAGVGALVGNAMGLLPFGIGAGVVLGALLGSSIKVAAQWEKALVFRLGKFTALKGPGLFFLIPFFDSAKLVDTRIQTIEIPHRQAITQDNVPVRIDGVIFMRVSDPSAAVIRVQDYLQAVVEYAQTALRDIVGSSSLDQILADREALGRKLEEMVEQEIDGWGLDVAAIRIQDIELPEDLKRVMARQASAEREKRATIAKSLGDREAAENLAAAAKMMATSPGALQLRTLQTLDGLGSSNSNTVVLTVPTEVYEAMRAIPSLADKLGSSASRPSQVTQLDVEE